MDDEFLYGPIEQTHQSSHGGLFQLAVSLCLPQVVFGKLCGDVKDIVIKAMLDRSSSWFDTVASFQKKNIGFLS